ncbi:MAG: hypothetical protein LUQ40_00075, partial [Methanomicrobiales archaeon]|nr:hypothetical protein [Methanomicrobiales archaeon]
MIRSDLIIPVSPQPHGAFGRVRRILAAIPRSGFVIGLVCMGWFLLRTCTKPSRVAYPCQQMAVTGGQIWLAAYVLPLVGAVRHRWWDAGRKYRVHLVIVLGSLAIILVALGGFSSDMPGDLTSVNATDTPGDTPAGYAEPRSTIFVVEGTNGNDGGIESLINLMDAHGNVTFYNSSRSVTGGKQGIIIKDDVVIIKVNCQWDERGGTNTDLVRGLIRA